MSQERKQVYLSSAERAAGAVVEVDSGEKTLLVEIPAGAKLGAVIRVRSDGRALDVEICDRPWGLDGSARLDLAPTRGGVLGDRAFWERASEELVESRRTTREFAGAIYAEKQDKVLVLTGMQRRAVGAPGEIYMDPDWGSLLWHTRPGLLSSLTAFTDSDRQTAQRCGRPLVTICTTMLSPAVAANFLFPLGMRPLMLAAGIKGLLALDRKRRGRPMLLGRAMVARIVYPNGEVAPVEHLGASLPREIFERTAFALDQKLGQAEKSARKLLQEVYQAAVHGRPPGSW